MITIEYRIGTYYTETTPLHIWTAAEEGEQIGELYVDIDTEVIMNIQVRPDRQGEGIARRLYETADAQLDCIKHAPAWGCTAAGICFAGAMGGETADDDTMALMGIANA